MDDRTYLCTVQYRDGANLSAREALHRRFSTNRDDWLHWVFDHLDLPGDAHILELGCGTGSLWLRNRDRLPVGWRITLSDLSPGMLDAARERLRDIVPSLTYQVVDAQSIPFDNGAFDAVIANHMLYHVPDRPRAFSEIGRVLRPGGRFHAATNGQGHLRELDELVRICAPETALETNSVGFVLENGAEQLQPWFADVRRHDFPDSLEMTEVEPLIAYVMSTTASVFFDEARIDTMRQTVADEIARTGAFRVTKVPGLFICQVGASR